MVTSWTLLITATERWGKAFLKTVFEMRGVGSQDHPYNLLRLILTIHTATFNPSNSYATRLSLALELGQDWESFFQPVDQLFTSLWGPSFLSLSLQTNQQPCRSDWLGPARGAPLPSHSVLLPHPFLSPTSSLLFPPSLLFPLCLLLFFSTILFWSNWRISSFHIAIPTPKKRAFLNDI